ncbi:pseudouridine synthase [Blautia liquoris]|uniref:Pseudouridine synthase n=1 Tax=Blautia liquoris TaxID=2779518 RepID=A0A7M2RD72_9FIRM|nr:pseudouridine synthase [Blautia liquoris]QOV18263.1 pseudouridine synthase [Blautia liquoris]
MIRLNKFLSDHGLCSRREGDHIIEAGRVSVNGKQAKVGMKIFPDDVVCLDGKTISGENPRVCIAYYKPEGIVCTFETKEKNNLLKSFTYPIRLTYAGRLDKASEGLLIMTNDGYLIDQMMRARNYHEKEYVVKVSRRVTSKFLGELSQGVYLSALNVKTRPCKVFMTGPFEFHIILTQGLNRQIRRMCEELGYQVKNLKRIRIMNIALGNLRPGEYRELTADERSLLDRQLKKNHKDCEKGQK